MKLELDYTSIVSIIEKLKKRMGSKFGHWVLVGFVMLGMLFLSACQNSEKKSVESSQSVERGQTTNTAGNLNARYLRSAALEGQVEEVRKAINQGVDVNASDEMGRTALMLAAYNGHSEIVQLLLDEGAKVSANNTEGRTPLIFAASGPYPETVALLLDSGADPDVTDNAEGWTALMFASAAGNLEVVNTLLDYDASVMLKDRDGDSAIDFARNNNHSQVVTALEEAQSSN